MLNINFLKKTADIKKKALNGEISLDELSNCYEKAVSQKPVVFQLETTNVCNMRCTMCPRTNQMQRKLGYMEPESYGKIIEQIEPYSPSELLKWRKYLTLSDFKDVFIKSDEDYFAFTISAESITLHGFGEPLLDPHIVERIKIAKLKNIPVYFSCNPNNMNEDLLRSLLDIGLDYLKYSVEGLDAEIIRKYRGVKVDMEQIYNIINKSIELVERNNYRTLVILTTLLFGKTNEENTDAFLKEWYGQDLFAYIKNAHHAWIYKDDDNFSNTSQYMRSFCEHPWMTVSILYDGTVVPCPLDYDGILAMGSVKEQSLEEIWNSKKYREFRKGHAESSFPECHYCSICDLPVMGEKNKKKKSLSL